MNFVNFFIFCTCLFSMSLLESKEIELSSHGLPKESALLKSRKRISTQPNRQFSGHDLHYFSNQTTNQDFINDKVRVNLICNPKSMVLKVNFTEQFRGFISVGKSNYSTSEQNQECSLRGNGSRNYLLQVGHGRCFTKFNEKLGQFSNVLFVRYHPSLETGGDYSKTLLCRFGLSDFKVD